MAINEEQRKTNSPATALAQGASIDSAAAAATNNAKISTSGSSLPTNRNHEIPSAGPTPSAVPAPGAAVPPSQPSEPKAPKITELERFERSEKDIFLMEQALQNVEKDVKFQQLGSIGEQIKQKVKKNIMELYDPTKTLDKTKGVAEGLSQISQVLETQGAQLTTEQTNKVKGGFALLASETDETKQKQIIGDILTSLGVQNPQTGSYDVDWKAIETVIGDVDEVVGNLVATGLADHVNIDETILNSLGYAPGELEDVLTEIGYTADEIAAILDPTKSSPVTLSAFQSKVQNYLDTEFKEVERLRSIAHDGSLGGAERGAALESLRMMGYKGILADEAIVTAINDQIQYADKNIAFAGKTYETLDELLDDENIAGVVSQYLNGDLEADDLPESLSALIDDNRQAFEDIVASLQTEVKQFDDTQKTWRDLKDKGVSDDFLKDFVPGYDPAKPFQTVDAAPPKSGIFSYVFGDKASKENAIVIEHQLGRLQSEAGLSKDMAKQVISALSDEDAKTFIENIDARENYMSNVALANQIDLLAADVAAGKPVSVPDLFSKIAGTELDWDGLMEAADALSAAGSLPGKAGADARVAIGVFNSLLELRKDPAALVKRLDDLVTFDSNGVTFSEIANMKGFITQFKQAAKTAKDSGQEHIVLVNTLRGQGVISSEDTLGKILNVYKPDTSNIQELGKMFDGLVGAPVGRPEIVADAFDALINAPMINNKPNPLKSLDQATLDLAKGGMQAVPDTQRTQVGDAIKNLSALMAATNGRNSALLDAKALPVLKANMDAVFAQGMNEGSWDAFKRSIPNYAVTHVDAAFNVYDIPRAWKAAFRSNGIIGDLSSNAVVQDMFHVFNNYRSAFGKDASKESFSDFLRWAQTYEKMGGKLFSSNPTGDYAVLSKPKKEEDPIEGLTNDIQIGGPIGQIAEGVKGIVTGAAKALGVDSTQKVAGRLKVKL